MPRIRPKPSLGGSAAVGGAWSDDRLLDAPAHEPELVGPALRLVPLTDRSGWHLAALTADGVEIGRLANVGSGKRAWLWSLKGPGGYCATRDAALAALAESWAGKR